jgi:hypothetical protein
MQFCTLIFREQQGVKDDQTNYERYNFPEPEIGACDKGRQSSGSGSA